VENFVTAALSRVNVGEIQPTPPSPNSLVNANHVLLWLIAASVAVAAIVHGAMMIYAWRRGRLGIMVRSEAFAHSVAGLVVVLAATAGIEALT
jgi:hypothetical protein